MISRSESLRRLPFDHYARYRLAADVVDLLRTRAALPGSEAGAPPRVLDIGGSPGSLAAFLPDADVIASDVALASRWHEQAPTLVLANGAALPFADGTFDVVVSLDTLEHVPDHDRPRLLAEAVRVARGWVLVACPCATPGVADADAALLAYVRRRFGEEFETVGVLQEHLAYGHPEPARVRDQLAATGADVARFPSGRLDRWLPMMVLFFHLLALGRDDPVERVQAWYNELFYRDDLRDPAYRQAFLCRAPAAAGPPADELVAALLPEAASAAPDTAALEVLRTGLSQELVEVAAGYRAEAERLQHELAAVQATTAEWRSRAEVAEQEAAALRAFRARVLAHPAVRLRGRLRRLLGRASPEQPAP